MLFDRKTVWAALASAALTVGCSSEEAASPPDAPAPAPAPAAAPAPKADDMKPAPAPEPTKTAPTEEKKPDAAPPAVEAPKTDPAPAKDAPKAAAAAKLSDEEVAEIKKLPADEQTVALKQAVCPVSSEHLGSMGAPVKVTAEGKTFYLCCKGCKKEVESDAKKVLEKLPAN